MRTGSVNYAILGALLGVLVLLGVLLVEQNHVEHRLIVQGQQIQALGEATDRLAARGVVAGGVSESTQANDEQPSHLLHPDVPNFLVARAMHWPSPGANLEGTLFRGWPTGDPKGFNPLIENAAELGELIATYVVAPIADLNTWTNPDEWHGELATRVEITDDYKELTMYLRKGVKWHPPADIDLSSPRYAWLRGDHELTAHDLEFTLDLMMNPQVQNGFLKNYFAELESWKAVDDYTFVVRWKKKQYLNIEQTLSLVPMPKFIFAYDEDGKPIPKETLGLRFNQHWYNNKGFEGAGPYKMVSYEPGAKIRLARNDDFYGDKPAIKEIVYPIYTDPTQTVLKLKSHELSFGVLKAGQYREEIQQYENAPTKPAGSPFFDGRIACKPVDEPAYRYIGWNADRPLFSDKRVRRAMTFALNRQAIIDHVFVGLGQIITGPYLPSTPYNDGSIKPIPFDLEQAKALLRDAGWQDTDGDGVLDKVLHPGDAQPTRFEFTFLIASSSAEAASLANIYKEDLLKIGVKMNIESAEWSLMQKRMEEKSFDAFIGAWLLPWDDDPFQIWHSSQADIPKGSNRVGFRNKEADAIIEKLRVTFDKKERVELAHRFHHILDDEQPYTFFMGVKSVFCWWNDVKDVVFAKSMPIPNSLPWSVARATN